MNLTELKHKFKEYLDYKYHELSPLTRQSIVSDSFYFTLHDIGFNLDDVLAGKVSKEDAKTAYMKEFNNINRACAYAAHHQYLLRFLYDENIADIDLKEEKQARAVTRSCSINKRDYFESDMDKYVKKFRDVYSADTNSRYMSYDHCRKVFLEYRKDPNKYDLITLNLYAYLASWGMLRNSFLMQKDYIFNKGVVEILCKEKYDSLLSYDPFIATEKDDKLIIELANEIRGFYLGKEYFTEGLNKNEVISNVSDTLVTKIILGTFACTVAYDTYVRKGLSIHNMHQNFCERSLHEIREYAKANKLCIEGQLIGLNKYYNPIKIIDMCLFERGFVLD